MNQLFVTTRKPTNANVEYSKDELAPIRDLEKDFARRMGILDAPYRLTEDDETARCSTVTDTVTSNNPPQTKADKQSQDDPDNDTVFDTDTPARGDCHRDHSSAD